MKKAQGNMCAGRGATNGRRLVVAFGLLVGTALGCESRVNTATISPPTLVPVDSVDLDESDSLYVARPGGMAVDGEGRIWVTDFFLNRAILFDPDGNALRVFGRTGNGPGEFGAIGIPVVLDSNVVGLLDYQPPEIEFFDTQSGVLLGRIAYKGTLTAMTARGASLWLGGIDPVTWFSVTSWSVPGAWQSPGAVPSSLAPDLVTAPTPYSASDVIRGTYGIVSLAPTSDGIWVGFGATPYVVHVDHDGTRVDSVYVPSRTRKGVPRDFVQRMDLSKTPYSELFSLASGLLTMAAVSASELVLVHFDAALNGRLITGRLFVSVLDLSNRRACVDAEIPVSDVGQPLVALSGERVYVLDQRVDEGETVRLRTVLRTMRVDTSSCAWIPVDGDDVWQNN